jgi:hypothetical protein
MLDEDDGDIGGCPIADYAEEVDEGIVEFVGADDRYWNNARREIEFL